MAFDQRRHFVDPLHQLVKTQYGPESGACCDICLSKLAGHAGHRCSACDIDLHDACADCFKETVSFFAHPWHTLELSRIWPHPVAGSPAGSCCDLCLEVCPPGSFVYRCTQCLFDVHPLCTMLPQTIRSPLHPEHDLRMVPSSGRCSACEQSLPVWHYVCPCAAVRLHIDCACGEPTTSACQGDGDAAAAAATRTSGGSDTAGTGRPRRRTVIAKFLLKTTFRIGVNAATGGLGSPVLDVLAAVFT